MPSERKEQTVSQLQEPDAQCPGENVRSQINADAIQLVYSHPGTLQKNQQNKAVCGEDSRYVLCASQPNLATVPLPHRDPTLRRVTEGRLDSESQGLMGRGYLAFP